MEREKPLNWKNIHLERILHICSYGSVCLCGGVVLGAKTITTKTCTMMRVWWHTCALNQRINQLPDTLGAKNFFLFKKNIRFTTILRLTENIQNYEQRRRVPLTLGNKIKTKNKTGRRDGATESNTKTENKKKTRWSFRRTRKSSSVTHQKAQREPLCFYISSVHHSTYTAMWKACPGVKNFGPVSRDCYHGTYHFNMLLPTYRINVVATDGY